MKEILRPRVMASLVALGSIAAGASAEELWDQGVELYVANHEWTAGAMEIQTTELDRKGNIKNEELRRFRSTAEGETISTVLVYAERNGTDITEQELLEANASEGETGNDSGEGAQGESGDGSSDGDSALPNPFDPAIQEEVEYSFNGTRTRAGVSHLVYDFRMAAEEKRDFVGTVWFDESTRVPVMIEASIEPLPRFARFVDFRAHFHNDPTRWYVTNVDFEGAGGFLIVYRHYKSSILFDNYFKSK